MTDRLTLERFRELADAYGGVIARWPERYRADASGIAAHPVAAAILQDALALDEALDTWQVTAPARPLLDRIAAQGPARASISSRARLWWSGIGIAATLAGAAAGVASVALVAPADISPGASTSFGDVSGRES